jgi:hypothetical protein
MFRATLSVRLGKMDLLAKFDSDQARLHSQTELPEVFAGRGFALAQLQHLDLGLDETGNAVIALRGLDGRLLGLKRRMLRPAPKKYTELPDPNGNPPWFAPGSGLVNPTSHRGVLCVEGELNAMLSWLALEHSGWAVVGLGSTFGPVPWDWLCAVKVPVVFSVDQGRAGAKSVQSWLAQANALSLKARRAEPLLADWDACEYGERCGLEALGTRWTQVLER